MKTKIFTIDKGEEFVCLSKIVSISVVIFVTVIWLIACFEAAETVLMLIIVVLKVHTLFNVLCAKDMPYIPMPTLHISN